MAAQNSSDRLFTREVVGVAVAFVLGAVLTILDATIVNVAVPVLARDLHASISTIQWVPTIYLLSFAAVIPVSGWATERYGAKRVWLTALALFVLGSLLSAAAQSIGQLLVARVVQGVGGGLVMPVGQAMLARVAGPHRMGRVMSVVGVPMLLAPIAGPVIGGALVDGASWRWIFLVNLPVGALALVLAARLLPADAGHPGDRLDVRGLLLASPGLALVLLGLAERSPAPLVAGAGLLVAFVVHARRASAPLVDVRLFARPAVAGSAGTMVLFGAAVFATLVLLPLYLQEARGLSALDAGLVLVPQGIGAALVMPLAGRAADAGRAGATVLAGLGLMLLGAVPSTQLGANTPLALIAAAQLVLGLGMGATGMPAMTAAYRVLARPEIARATAALNALQRVG